MAVSVCNGGLNPQPIAAIHGSHLLAKTRPHLGPEHEMDN